MAYDKKIRSITKSFVWRLVGTVLLASLVYFLTGDWRETSLITVSFNAIQILLYYLHERMWEQIDWGRSEELVR